MAGPTTAPASRLRTRSFALGGQRHPEFVMAEHPAVEKPLMTFPNTRRSQSSTLRRPMRSAKGRLFIAFFGHLTPMTGTPPKEHGGHRVVAINPRSNRVEDFFTKKDHGHAEHRELPMTRSAGEGQEAGHDESVTPWASAARGRSF